VLESKYSNDFAFSIGESYAWRGEGDLAFSWLHRAYAAPAVWHSYHRVHTPARDATVASASQRSDPKPPTVDRREADAFAVSAR